MASEPGAAWPVAIAPGFLLSLVVSLLIALLFHALFGSRWRGLALALIAALLGFTGGEAFARWSGTGFGMFGTVHLLHGVGGAVVALAVLGALERRGTQRAARAVGLSDEGGPEGAPRGRR